MGEERQALAVEMAGLLSAIPANKTIRFSIFDGAYQWQSVKTRDRAVSRLLLFMWNNRDALLAALQPKGQTDEG